MFIILQNSRKNGRLFARKSALLLLLAMLTVFAGSCSKKMPCPNTAKAEKQAKTGKKKKAPKKQVTEGDGAGDGTETAEASAALLDEGSSEPAKPKITATKNTYNKNGLLTKKKYKRLRNNPGRKRSRKNGGILSIFSGKKKAGSKSKRSNTNVESGVE